METIPVLPGVSLRSARAVSAILFCLFASLLSPSISAQRATNTNTAYQQLRGLLPGGEVITVKDFTLHRDAAEFTFRTGRFAFFGEVNGKITGVVFRGDGHLHIAPPVASERHNLMLLTKSENYDEDFDQGHAALRAARVGDGHRRGGSARHWRFQLPMSASASSPPGWPSAPSE